MPYTVEHLHTHIRSIVGRPEADDTISDTEFIDTRTELLPTLDDSWATAAVHTAKLAEKYAQGMVHVLMKISTELALRDAQGKVLARNKLPSQSNIFPTAERSRALAKAHAETVVARQQAWAAEMNG